MVDWEEDPCVLLRAHCSGDAPVVRERNPASVLIAAPRPTAWCRSSPGLPGSTARRGPGACRPGARPPRGGRCPTCRTSPARCGRSQAGLEKNERRERSNPSSVCRNRLADSEPHAKFRRDLRRIHRRTQRHLPFAGASLGWKAMQFTTRLSAASPTKASASEAASQMRTRPQSDPEAMCLAEGGNVASSPQLICDRKSQALQSTNEPDYVRPVVGAWSIRRQSLSQGRQDRSSAPTNSTFFTVRRLHAPL